MYAPLNRLVGVSHEGDKSPVTAAYTLYRGFLEKGLDPETVGINQRQDRLTRHHLAAKPQIQVGDVAVHGGQHLRELNVQLRLLQRGTRLANTGIGVAGGAKGGTHLGEIGLSLGQRGMRLGKASNRPKAP